MLVAVDDDALQQLMTLLADTPSIPVVAAVPFSTIGRAAAAELVRLGISEFVDLDLEWREDAVLRRVLTAHARPFKRRLEAALPRRISANALTLVRAAAEVAVDGGARADLARVFGVHERTTAGWCSHEHLPPPRRLLAWVRVLLALTLLEEEGRSVMNVARCCGYSDDSSLRRGMEGLLGPMENTRAWTFAAGQTLFADELGRRRDAERAGTLPMYPAAVT